MLWYGAFVAAAGAFYRRVLPKSVAFFALLLFAVDDAHASGAGWIAARYAIVAGTFSILALLSYVRFREGSRLRWLALALEQAASTPRAGYTSS